MHRARSGEGRDGEVGEMGGLSPVVTPLKWQVHPTHLPPGCMWVYMVVHMTYMYAGMLFGICL